MNFEIEIRTMQIFYCRIPSCHALFLLHEDGQLVVVDRGTAILWHCKKCVLRNTKSIASVCVSVVLIPTFLGNTCCDYGVGKRVYFLCVHNICNYIYIHIYIPIVPFIFI